MAPPQSLRNVAAQLGLTHHFIDIPTRHDTSAHSHHHGRPCGHMGPESSNAALRPATDVMQGCFVATATYRPYAPPTALSGAGGQYAGLPMASLPQPQDVAHVSALRCLPVLQAAQPATTLLAFGRVDASADGPRVGRRQ